MGGSISKSARSAFIVGAGIVALILLRLLADQVQGYRTAERYLNSGDKKNAIMHFDRVLNAHIPFSPLERSALDRLLEIASDYESQGERELALACYETARSSRYLTRGVSVPDEWLIQRVNPKIATIKAGLAVDNGTEVSFDAAYERQIRLLRQDQSPSIAMSVIVLTLFFLYIATMLMLATSIRMRYLAVSIVLLLVWMVTLYAA